MMASVSRATSAAGISTEISRLTPSSFLTSVFFVSAAASVGLTLSLSNTWPTLVGGIPGKHARSPHSYNVNLECKDRWRSPSNGGTVFSHHAVSAVVAHLRCSTKEAAPRHQQAGSDTRLKVPDSRQTSARSCSFALLAYQAR